MALRNIAWLGVEKVLRMGFVFLALIFFARITSEEIFGEISFARSVLSIMATFSYLGLSSFLVKELIDRPGKSGEIVGTALGLKFGVSLICVLVASTLAPTYFSSDYNALLFIIAILPITFYSADVFELYFQSNLGGKSIAKPRLISVGVASTFLVMGWWFGLNPSWLLGCFVLESFVFFVSSFLLFKSNFKDRLSFNFSCAKAFLLVASPLLISGFLAQANLKVDQIMIREILGASSVAEYAVCVNLLDPLSVIAVVLMNGLFPIIVKKSLNGSDYEGFFQVQKLVSFLALLVSVIIVFGSELILNLLYGAKYMDSAQILRVHAFSAIFLFWGQVYFKWIFIERLYYFTVVSHGLGALVNIGMNLYLLPKMGPLGASFSTIISYFIAFSLILLAHPKTRALFGIQIKSLVFCYDIIGTYKWIRKSR